jgi:hypothetical protein
MSFVHRQISCTIKIGQGSFGDGGFDVVKLSGPLRASAQVEITGGPAMAHLDLAVYGLSPSLMNQVATIGPVRSIAGQRNNEVVVEAGDTSGGLGVVYNGTITEAALDFSGMPNCSLRIHGGAGTMLAMRPVPPTSYNGLVDVATIFASLAKQAQVTFQNNGVTAQLIDPYYPGTVWDQMERCAQAANIDWIFDEKTVPNSVVIWPKNGDRGGSVPVISAETGMIGYPCFVLQGIECMCLYNPSISVGQTVQINSTLKGATGRWTIKRINHHLESETPGGQWSSSFGATKGPDDIALFRR